jgi:DNA-binding Lrp family transcriptional regulator
VTEHSFPDHTDLLLLEALQDDFPIVPRPFLEIAQRTGISERDLLTRLKRLADSGVLRGISPVLEARKLGIGSATLVAAHVPEGRIAEVAGIISSYPEVSHNFQRDHHYSLWFTICGKDDGEVTRVLWEIAGRAGIAPENLLNLPTVERLKIDVRFPFLTNGQGDSGHGQG